MVTLQKKGELQRRKTLVDVMIDVTYHNEQGRYKLPAEAPQDVRCVPQHLLNIVSHLVIA